MTEHLSLAVEGGRRWALQSSIPCYSELWAFWTIAPHAVPRRAADPGTPSLDATGTLLVYTDVYMWQCSSEALIGKSRRCKELRWGFSKWGFSGLSWGCLGAVCAAVWGAVCGAVVGAIWGVIWVDDWDTINHRGGRPEALPPDDLWGAAGGRPPKSSTQIIPQMAPTTAPSVVRFSSGGSFCLTGSVRLSSGGTSGGTLRGPLGEPLGGPLGGPLGRPRGTLLGWGHFGGVVCWCLCQRLTRWLMCFRFFCGPAPSHPLGWYSSLGPSALFIRTSL